MTQTIVSELKRCLTNASKSTDKKSSYPVLAMIFIDVSNRICAMSTNTLAETPEKFSVDYCGVKHPQSFYTCVPLALIGWLKTCDPKSIVKLQFSERTQTLTVTNDRSKAQFKCIDGDEFPWMNVLEISDI